MTEQNQLSARELEILKLVATGASNKNIANELVISVNTVKVHLRNIYNKLEVSSRTEASMWAVQAGVVATGGDVELTVEPTPATTKAEHLPMRLWWMIGGIVFAAIALVVIFVVGWLQIQKSKEAAIARTTTQAFEQDRWGTLATMPTARSNFASAVVGGAIYVIGGETESGVTASVDVYHVDANTWEPVSEMPVALADIQAVTVGGKIYVPGGRRENGDVSVQLLVYDPQENVWQEVSSLPVSLSAYALVTFEGKLYLFGGWNGEQFVDTVLTYDPTLDSWEEKTPLPSPRGWSGAAVSGGKIHVIGGYDGANHLDAHVVYAPDQDGAGQSPWRVFTPLPAGFSRFGIVSVADIIHIVGGKSMDAASAQAYKYISPDNVWQTALTPFDEEWSDLGAVFLGEDIYLIGGKLGGQRTDQHITYQAVYLIMLPALP